MAQPAILLKDVMDVVALVEEAGQIILSGFGFGLTISYKENGSVITSVDLLVDQYLSLGLKQLTPGYPIVSEEAYIPPYTERQTWDRFWLMDPLDGTRAYVKGHRDFVTCLALIENGVPIVGIIHHPVYQVTYYALRGQGAYRKNILGEVMALDRNVQPITSNISVLGSYFSLSERLHPFLQAVEAHYQKKVSFLPMNSAYKFCCLVDGRASFYPRFGPTMEWDIAAGQILVEEAGLGLYEYGTVTPLRYNKASLTNPDFWVSPDPLLL